MNMLPTFLKFGAGEITYVEPPLDLDPDFEEACARSLQQPMQTPVERLREATENIVTVLRDEDRAHDDLIAEYRVKLAAEEMAKEANLLEIAKAERALAELAYDPADDAKKSYDLAVQVKRERGDTEWPVRASEASSPSPKPDKPKKRAVEKAPTKGEIQ